MDANKTLIPKEYQGLFDNIGRYVTLTDSEKERIAAIITLTPIKRRQFIDQPGYISLYRNYVVKGAFRSFFLDKDGKATNEVTLQ